MFSKYDVKLDMHMTENDCNINIKLLFIVLRKSFSKFILNECFWSQPISTNEEKRLKNR